MEIANWRKKIDEVDLTLVDLLNERAKHAVQIGEIKHQLKQAVYAPEREQEVLERVIKYNKGPLSNEAIKRMFEYIIDESRRLEKHSTEDGHD